MSISICVKFFFVLSILLCLPHSPCGLPSSKYVDSQKSGLIVNREKQFLFWFLFTYGEATQANKSFFSSSIFSPFSNPQIFGKWLFIVVTSCYKVRPAVARCDQLLPGVISCCQVWPAIVRCDQLLPGVTRCFHCVTSCFHCVTSCFNCVTSCCQVWHAVASHDQLLSGLTSFSHVIGLLSSYAPNMCLYGLGCSLWTLS